MRIPLYAVWFRSGSPNGKILHRQILGFCRHGLGQVSEIFSRGCLVDLCLAVGSIDEEVLYELICVIKGRRVYRPFSSSGYFVTLGLEPEVDIGPDRYVESVAKHKPDSTPKPIRYLEEL